MSSSSLAVSGVRAHSFGCELPRRVRKRTHTAGCVAHTQLAGGRRHANRRWADASRLARRLRTLGPSTEDQVDVGHAAPRLGLVDLCAAPAAARLAPC
eukprot:scaffold15445_cov64-Phaeocystis_antarctica.AAC.2